MSELIKQFVSQGILPSDHGFEDEGAVLEALKSALIERAELKAASGAGKTADEEPHQKVDPQPSTAKTSNTQASLEMAEWLAQQGKITRKDGRWHSDAPDFSSHVQALNERDEKVQHTQVRMAQALSEDPSKFVKEFLGDSLKSMIEEQIKGAVDPLNQRLERQQQEFVRQKTEAERWFEEKQEDLKESDSPLRKAYLEIYSELEDQYGREGMLPEDEKARERLLHQMAAPKAEMIVLQQTKDPAAPAQHEAGSSPEAPETQDRQIQKSVEDAEKSSSRSVIDKLNDGEEIVESGERNNGAARRLNEHAQQTGDVAEPIANGRVNFMAIADKEAQKLGVKY